MLTAIFLTVLGVLWILNVQGRPAVIIIFLFFVPYFICGYTLTSQRLRDMGLTGWLALLWIPVAVSDRYIGGAAWAAFAIVLCVVPGTAGDNRYGPDPLA
ncbi:DUF805 domain-containing protein [Mariluticola halotolerans]|uniref:DUF805 domain-containing protein n=1 Tax=Mariluticola halotolerans TaxID=2909283 RepID=UPI0034A0B1EF